MKRISFIWHEGRVESGVYNAHCEMVKSLRDDISSGTI